MSADRIREKIERLIKEKGFNPTEISLLIGRPRYFMFFYLKRKSPKRLPEVERRQLAKLLEVEEQELTDLPLNRITTTEMIVNSIKGYPLSVNIDMLDVTACCGDGVENYHEKTCGKWVMPQEEFRSITFAHPDNIKMIRVSGDSMQPTLKGGDWVLVDVTRNTPDSDGMFLIRTSGGLAVKRLQAGLTDEIIVKSDNPAYDNLTAKVGEIKIIGKVIYTLKAERVG